MTATRKHRASHSRNSHHNRSAKYFALPQGAASAIENVTPQLEMLRDKGMETAEAVEHMVVKHPKKSILVAFGIGYVIARLGRYL